MNVRVAVTTTSDRAPHVAALVEARGLVPVVLPCIRIEPPTTEARALLRAAAPDADWILVTSARAVRSVWPGGDMPSVPVAAVGPASADAAREAGGRVELIGDAGAANLAALLVDKVAGKTVVFPHARAADPATAAALRSAGAEVVAVSAYDTVPIAPAADPVDAIVLGSPSALEGWTSTRTLDGLTVAVMGETTAAAVRALGREPDVVPSEPSLEAVVDGLVAHLQGESR